MKDTRSTDEMRESLQRQLEQYRKNRLRLLEQKAQYGLNVPLDILNGIDAAEASIAQIETRLKEIDQLASQPLPGLVETGPVEGGHRAEAAETGLLETAALSDPALAPLKEALDRGSLVLFIGADLPTEITGLPSRAGLASALASRYGLDESLSLAEVAQRVSRAGSRFEFTDFLRNQLDTWGRQPQPFHEQIATLVGRRRPEILITIAYDNLLELALQRAGVGFNRVVRSSHLHFLNPDRPTLIKLYGDVQEPETLVVTDQDHTDLLRNPDKAGLVDEVRRTFSRNTLLFLGYNLADPDFRFLFDQLAGDRFARTAYAVWPNLPEPDVQMWRDRRIIILDTNPLPALI